MKSTRACILPGLLLLAAVSPAQAGLRSPLAGQGDFEFVADMPVFPQEGETTRVDFTLRLDHHQMRFRPAYGHPLQAEVELRLKVAREGMVAVDTTQVYEFQAPTLEVAQSSQRFELIEIPLRIGAGNWAVTVEVTDRQASREGRRRRIHATANGVLRVPVAASTPTMSDPEFRLGAADASLPNPERLYGVVQDTLDAYFEIRGTPTGVARTLEVEVLDPVYGGMDRQTLRFEGRGEVEARLYRLPLATFPEGNYVLRLRPTWIQEESPREYEFTVVWKMGRFADAGGDLLLDAKLLFDDETLDRFQKLPRAAQTAMLADFWEGHDPTPGTSRNEVYDRFRERMAFAWRFFGESLLPGPLTDRGRTYVRLGPPKDRDVRVLPSNDDDLESAITRVHDRYQIEFEGVTAREQASKDDALGGGARATERDQIASRERRRLRGRVGSEGSFELWEYDFNGDPLFDEVENWSENIGYRFLFVDRTGDGSYRLEYSNVATRR